MTAATMISSHYDSSEEEEEQNQDQLDEHVARIAIPSPVSSSFQTDPANDRSTTSSSRSHAADDIPTSSSASSSSYSTSNPASLTDSPPASSPLHCSTCGASPPRYCCPGCSTSSCSLACVTSHKARTGCTGKRPRTSYVPLAQFTAGQLQHDLFFLEEVSREAGKTMRHPLLQKAAMHVREKGAEDEGAGIVSAFAGGAVGGRSVALQRECMRRGIKVMVMPEGMKRHQINSSGYQARTGELSWHVEWLLDAHALTMHQHSVDGSLTWRAALINVLSPSPAPPRNDRRSRRTRALDSAAATLAPIPAPRAPSSDPLGPAVDHPTPPPPPPSRVVAHHSDVHIRQQLQRYADAVDALRLFMRVPMTAATDAVYYPLSTAAVINESLVGLTLIEFPTVHVVFPEDAAQYHDHRTPRPAAAPRKRRPEPVESTDALSAAAEERPVQESGQFNRGVWEDPERRARNNRAAPADDAAPFKRWT